MVSGTAPHGLSSSGGGLHGLYLAAERVLSARFGKARLWSSRAGRTFLWFLTFVAVLVTWVFFRATSFEQAFGITAAMFGGEGGFGSIASFDARVAVVLMGALLLVQAATRNRTLAEIVRVLPWWLWSLALTAMIVALVLHPGADRAFIYFQF